MTNQSTLAQAASRAREAFGLIADTVFAGLFHTNVDELLPPNVERRNGQLLVKVVNPSEERRTR